MRVALRSYCEGWGIFLVGAQCWNWLIMLAFRLQLHQSVTSKFESVEFMINCACNCELVQRGLSFALAQVVANTGVRFTIEN